MASVTISSSTGYEAWILNTTKEANDHAVSLTGKPLLIGEYTIPTGANDTPNSTGRNGNTWSTVDQDQMNAAWEKWQHYCHLKGIERAMWATGYGWSWGYIDNGDRHEYNPYTATSQSPGSSWLTNNQADTFEKYPNYINWATNEFSDTDSSSAKAPTQADFAFHINRGTKRFRYVVGQKDSQNWLWDNVGQVVRSDKLLHMEYVLNRCYNAGGDIILSILHPANNTAFAQIEGNNIAGTASTVGAGYNDYIAYCDALLNSDITDMNGITIKFKNHPALYAVDICNEPQYGNTTNAATWNYCAQEIINDYRDGAGINYQGLLYVPSGGYSHLYNFVSDVGTFTDSANNFQLTAHFYTIDYDAPNSGATTTVNNYFDGRVGETAFSETIQVGNNRRVFLVG